jgi:hypothetical protein
MQLGGVAEQRRRAHEAYALQALRSSGLSAEVQAKVVARFLRSFPALWKVPWGNHHKEPLWRLAVNGVRGAGGHDICLATPCLCGHQLTATQVQRKDGSVHRQHAYWDCPVAQAVREQLQRGLGGREISQWQVWLAQPPRGVQLVVWRVVAMAALDAVDVGRRFMWSQHAAAAETAVEAGQRRAVTTFWMALEDFAHRGRRTPPHGWDAVGARHPFLAVQIVVPAPPRLRVVLPD